MAFHHQFLQKQLPSCLPFKPVHIQAPSSKDTGMSGYLNFRFSNQLVIRTLWARSGPPPEFHIARPFFLGGLYFFALARLLLGGTGGGPPR